MKFDPAASPLGPTPQQFADLGDLLITVEELYTIYGILEHHYEIQGSIKELELFSVCRDQLDQESKTLRDLIDHLRTGYRTERDRVQSGTNPFHYEIIPDIQVPNANEQFLDLVRRALRQEFFLEKQLSASLALAQNRHQVKLELQLKMAVLGTGQRQTLLDDQYGAALSNSLLEGLKRKTSRLFSSITRSGRLGLR